jgi:DNA ligase-1
MVDVRWVGNVELGAAGLHLDPPGHRALAFVSHAHADHAGKHAETILTPETARLLRLRYGKPEGILHELSYGEAREWADFRARLLPAGHVLGSAMLHYEDAAGSLLYTGDCKVRAGISCEAARFEPAETLIMETTFGLPKYEFPPTDEVIARVVEFCRQTLEDGDTPVLLGYSLGKAQEILAALAEAGLSFALHPAVWKITELYRKLGVVLPEGEKLGADGGAGRVVICPPHVRGTTFLQRIPRRRVAFLSGWAVEPGAVHRYGCDAVFPLSDHADYPGLLRIVEMVNPRRVLTLHGFATEFARDLRALGVEAWALTGPDQLELGLPLAAASRVEETAAVRPPPVLTERSGFGRFCLVCEKINESPGRLAKVGLLAEYLRRLREVDLGKCAHWFTGSAFARGREEPLGIGPAQVRRALAQVSGQSEMQLRVLGRQLGDQGLLARKVLANRTATRRWEVGEMQAMFHRLRETRSALARLDLLAGQLASLDALEACYFIKLCLGDLRIGLRDGLVEEAIAEAFAQEADTVQEAGMLLGEMGKLAVLARQNRLATAALTIFQPLRSMLAGVEHDEESLWERFAAQPDFSGYLWAENKLDGVRAQIHSDGQRVEIYSRDLRSLTATFPELLAAVAGLGREVVLDGEILAWQDGRPLPFAALQRRLGRKQGDLFLAEEVPVEFHAFDCLRCDGQTLVREPLQRRREILEALPWQAPLHLVPAQKVGSVAALEEAFLASRAAGHEGLVVKNPTSVYSPGRRGLAWIKRKKALATLDVVVVAVESGHGKRVGVLSDYTFAVRGEGNDLLPIGKAYTGLTDLELEEMTARFQALALRQRGRKIEVRPEVVIEVAFDAIRPSNRHRSGLALRFPRIKRLRPDKSVEEIDTLQTAWALVPGGNAQLPEG